MHRVHPSVMAVLAIIALCGFVLLIACPDSDPAPSPDAVTDVAETPDAPGTEPRVVINEVFVTGAADWVELYNAGEATAELAGWVFRDDDPTHAYTFGAGTTLPPGDYLLLARGEGGFDFGLGSADSALLYDGDRLVDGVTWVEGEIPLDRSYGRLPNGTGPFTVLFAPSPGQANPANPVVVCGDGQLGWTEICDGADFGGLTCAYFGFGGGALACVDCAAIDTGACTPPTSPVVINEVSSTGDDPIELLNLTAEAVDLGGWSLRDDSHNIWFFPAERAIAPGEYLVLVKGLDHDFGVGSEDFIELRDADGTALDFCAWRSGEAAVSYCRRPDGVGGFQPCAVPSFGAPNP